MKHNSYRRRDVLKIVAGAPFAACFLGGSRSWASGLGRDAGPAKVFLEPFDFQGVRLLNGMFRKQYAAARDFFHAIPDDDILKGFRKRANQPAPGKDLGGWNLLDPNIQLGQWMSAMARMFRAEDDQPMLDKAVRLMSGWAETLEPSDYFAQCRWPTKPHYAFDKAAQGLLDLYSYGGRTETLALLEKITDWAADHLDRSRKIPDPSDRDAAATEWYTLTETLYRAYRMTRDLRYKSFGDVWRYPSYWGTFSTPVPAARGLHAYSHVNTLGSAAMACAVQEDPVLLQSLVDAYDYFQRTQCYATGGFGPDENLMPPDGSLGASLESEANSFETPCGSWAVFKFARQLMALTGQARFGDWIERILYNGIGAALPMASGGRTFYYADYRLTGGRKVYHPDPYPCCAGSYPLAVAEYHNIIYFRDPGSLYVNLFVPSQVDWNKDGVDIRIVQETAYPEDERSVLTVQAKSAVPFRLKFRVPSWCLGATAEINGAKVEVEAKPGTWCAVERTWSPGDRMVLRIPMHIALAPIDAQHPRRVAVTYGPVVLVRTLESALSPAGEDPSQWIVAAGRPLEFLAPRQPEGRFIPFYQVGRDIPYQMYFDLKG